MDITIPELEVARVAATAESEERGAAIVARAVAALGGAERLAAVVSMRQSGSAVATMGEQQMQMEMSAIFLFPDRLRQEVKLPFGTMTTVVTGEGGFAATPQGVQDLPESQLAEARKSMRRNLVALLRGRQDGEFEAVALGEDEIDGRPVERVQVTMAGDTVQLAVAADNGEVVEISYRGSAFGGPPGEIRQRYSDFRDVDGLRLPFATSSTFEGSPFIEFTAERIEVDGAVDAAAFERPAAEPAQPGGPAG